MTALITNLMILNQPRKYCKKCGSLIPDNDQADPKTGKLSSRPKLACEICARRAGAALPKKAKRKPGEVDPNQMPIDAPTIKI